MEKRLTMILACLFLSIGMALAQTHVSGTVTSSDGEPLVGVTVKVVGTNAGALTNSEGRFELNVPAGKQLQISYIGMRTKTVKASAKMNIVLEPEVGSLDEVMVVAYGTEKRSAFTGSAAVVGSKEIEKVQVTSALESLKGKAAGVQMYNASGAPGSTSTFRIRGISSINAGNDPLIVVDGVPYDGDLNTINPGDIENITVLKDAASSALYGARGSNGVIMVTTKNGKRGQGTVTFDMKIGSNSKMIPEYNTIDDPAKYYEMWYQVLKNYAVGSSSKLNAGLGFSEADAHAWASQNLTASGSGDYGLGYQVFNVPAGQEFIGTNGKVNPNATLGNVVNGFYLIPDDWVDATFNNSTRQEYNLQANGANDRGSFYTSFNYLSYDGITVSSNYERLTGRMKADYKIKDWLKFGANATYTHYRQNNTGDDEGKSASSDNVFALTKIAPIYPIYNRDANGNIISDAKTSGIDSYDYGDGSVMTGMVRPYLNQANPLSSLQLDKNLVEGNTVNFTGTIEVSLPYGFRVTSTNNIYNDEYRSTQTTNRFYGQYKDSNGIIHKGHGRVRSYDLQQMLNWAHQYGEHNISAVFGHEYYDYRTYSLSGSTKNQFSPANDELNGAVTANGNPSSSRGEYNTESWIFRTNYNWGEKYFGEFSLLRQASSRFAKDNRWGTFWSIGGAWLISKENWFNASWVDELRFKASYGQVGNDRIGNYLYTNRYTITPSNGDVALVASSTFKNPNIKWETGNSFNTGFDFSFLNQRISGNIEYFYRKTSDMLNVFYLPYSYGYTNYYDNIGDMSNQGFEITVNADLLRGRDYVWSAYANFSYDHNKVTKITEKNKTMTMDGHEGYTNGSMFVGEGLPLFTWRLHKYAGVDKETGEALYYKMVAKTDEKGDPVKDASGNTVMELGTTADASTSDYYLCDGARPEVYGGFGTSASWKGLDFSISFSYQLGGHVMDSQYQSEMAFSRGYAFHTDLLNAWTPTNKNTDVPRLFFNDQYSAATSDRFLISASCLTLDNIQLGYTLPTQWVKHIGLQKVRLYCTADNVWVWSKRQGLDPRQSISGGSNATYAPFIRTISGGLTVSF